MARVDIDEAGLAEIRVGMAGADLDRRAQRVLAAQVVACPVDTGRLRGSLTIQRFVAADGSPVRRIGTNVHYAMHVESGTGLFGPHHHVIVPTTKQALYWPGANHPVRSVKGQRAQPFIGPSLAAAVD